MRKTYKSILVGLCTASILVGCASKDVEYEGSSSSSNQNQFEQSNGTVDSKIDSINGDEQTVDNGMGSESNTEVSNSNNLIEGVNSIQSDINGNVVTLQSVHFAFDKFILTDEMRQIATTNSSKIDTTTQSYSNLKIKLEGNCDEWGTDEYNYALGLKRAKTAKDALIADGVSENKIMMVSFGESNPICTDRNVACWKLNRRVDYRLLP